jgi:hypothetical protein
MDESTAVEVWRATDLMFRINEKFILSIDAFLEIRENMNYFRKTDKEVKWEDISAIEKHLANKILCFMLDGQVSLKKENNVTRQTPVGTFEKLEVIFG